MKTKNGSKWYVLDLDNYTNEFLIEIIEDLLSSQNILTCEKERANYRKGVKKEIKTS